jgi:hypothetical protein
MGHRNAPLPRAYRHGQRLWRDHSDYVVGDWVEVVNPDARYYRNEAFITKIGRYMAGTLYMLRFSDGVEEPYYRSELSLLSESRLASDAYWLTYEGRAEVAAAIAAARAGDNGLVIEHDSNDEHGQET